MREIWEEQTDNDNLNPYLDEGYTMMPHRQLIEHCGYLPDKHRLGALSKALAELCTCGYPMP